MILPRVLCGSDTAPLAPSILACFDISAESTLCCMYWLLYVHIRYYA